MVMWIGKWTEEPGLSEWAWVRSYVSHSEISNRATIHHWMTCYWSQGQPLFSAKLYHKKKNNKYLHTLNGTPFCWPQQKKTSDFFFALNFTEHIRQFCLEMCTILFCVWNRFKRTLTLKGGEFQLPILVILQCYLSDECCRLFCCAKKKKKLLPIRANLSIASFQRSSP